MSKIRIISGKYGGLNINAVSGRSTRPTTDRVREAWASTITSLSENGFDGLKVLDAFAGSGALGFEALSRGAEHVVFCEKNQNAIKTLRTNVTTLGLRSNEVEVIRADTFNVPLNNSLLQHAPFDLVCLDPPYMIKTDKIKQLLVDLSKKNFLAKGCLISYEHSLESVKKNNSANNDKDNFADVIEDGRFELATSKTYGTIKINYFIYH